MKAVPESWHRPNTPLWSAHQIIERLQAIDEDLKERIPVYESAARDFYTLKRDIDLEEAKAFQRAQGTVESRKTDAKVYLEGMALWERFKEAEGEFNAKKVAINSLESRASICQSLLKAQREQAAA